jgi:hypothetical protein
MLGAYSLGRGFMGPISSKFSSPMGIMATFSARRRNADERLGLSIFGMISARTSELDPTTLFIRVYFIVCI